MSTRCQIGFYEKIEGTNPLLATNLNNFEALLYRHYDGYPDGVLPDIIPFLKDFHAKRNINDLEYASAQLLAHLIKTCECGEYLGHGICKCFHWDIEYFYAIFSDGTVYVYKTPFDTKPENFELLHTFHIDDWNEDTEVDIITKCQSA